MVNLDKKLIVGIFIILIVILIFARAFLFESPDIDEPEVEIVPSEEPVYSYNYTYNITNTYPHDPTAFTQGLVFENGALYEGTGREGFSSIRKVDLTTGEILKSHKLSAKYFGEGITIFDNKIIQLTWRSNVGFVYDMNTFDLLEEFTYPTEGWGITHDGERLIMSDGTSTIYFLDPVTFDRVGSINVSENGTPIIFLNELEYIKGEIYANVWYTDSIVRIDPETGNVTGRINLTGLINPNNYAHNVNVLNGIAYDNENGRLFVTGKYWPKLFEIELVPIA